MTGERWIVIPRWDGPTGFQHYRDRDPKWIKVYVRLMSDDAYMHLTGHVRAILHGLWLEYASSHSQVRLDTVSLTRRLNLRVTMQHLETLNHAGFIEFSASKPLAPRYQDASLEEEKEREELSEGTSAVGNPKAVPNEARPQANGTYADELAALALDEALTAGELNGKEIDEPYFARLLVVCGDTEENFVKLRRAARGKPTAATITALEAATAPSTRDPLAVALTVLADYGNLPAT